MVVVQEVDPDTVEMVVRSAGVLARMKAHQKAQLVRLLSKGLQVSDDCHLKVICCSKIPLLLLLPVFLLLLPTPLASPPPSPLLLLLLLLLFLPCLLLLLLGLVTACYSNSGNTRGKAAPHATESECMYFVTEQRHER